MQACLWRNGGGTRGDRNLPAARGVDRYRIAGNERHRGGSDFTGAVSVDRGGSADRVQRRRPDLSRYLRGGMRIPAEEDTAHTIAGGGEGDRRGRCGDVSRSGNTSYGAVPEDASRSQTGR